MVPRWLARGGQTRQTSSIATRGRRLCLVDSDREKPTNTGPRITASGAGQLQIGWIHRDVAPMCRISNMRISLLGSGLASTDCILERQKKTPESMLRGRFAHLSFERSERISERRKEPVFVRQSFLLWFSADATTVPMNRSQVLKLKLESVVKSFRPF